MTTNRMAPGTNPICAEIVKPCVRKRRAPQCPEPPLFRGDFRS
jgi:hypothetical protein